MEYIKLLSIAEKENIEIVEMKLTGRNKGLYADKVIAISSKIDTTTERTCILAEELGHYYTTAGNIIDQSKLENRKQELKARRWAVKKLIRVEQFIDAFDASVKNRADLAEFLGVTEEFIEMAIKHFKAIYGHSHTIGEYTIFFDPLWIYKSIE